MEKTSFINHFIKFENIDDHEIDILKSAGISVKNLDTVCAYFDRRRNIPDRSITGFMKFQEDILRTGNLIAPSPFSGEMVLTNQGYPVFWPINFQAIFYQFRGDQDYFLILQSMPVRRHINWNS